MTKQLAAILVLILLTSFGWYRQQSNCTVNISYVGLPNLVITNYSINDKELRVFETVYDSNSDLEKSRNRHSYRNIDNSTLVKFIDRVNWDTIPTNLTTPALDGDQFDIEIGIRNEMYQFNIDNTYHPIFDSLLTICNELIPREKVRDEYKIYYFK